MIRAYLLLLAVVFVFTATLWLALQVTLTLPSSGAPVSLYLIAAALTGLRAIPTSRKAHHS